jgi:putative DNA primase/helicase
MNAGNLLPVATAARTAWPGAELVICADNDRHTAGNPGVTAATAAAKATGARLIVPEFPTGAEEPTSTTWRRCVAGSVPHECRRIFR